MWFYDIINVIVAIAVIVAILYLLFRLFVLKQGNERVILLPKRKTSFQLADMNMSSMTLFCDVPFVNKGRQLGTIMDLFPRPLLPEEHFDGVKVDAWLWISIVHATMVTLKLSSSSLARVVQSAFTLP